MKTKVKWAIDFSKQFEPELQRDIRVAWVDGFETAKNLILDIGIRDKNLKAIQNLGEHEALQLEKK